MKRQIKKLMSIVIIFGCAAMTFTACEDGSDEIFEGVPEAEMSDEEDEKNQKPDDN